MKNTKLCPAARMLLAAGLMGVLLMLGTALSLLLGALPFSSRDVGTLLLADQMEQSARSVLFCAVVFCAAAQEKLT